MKTITALFCSALTLVVLPALAVEDGNSCIEKSKHLKGAERDALIKSCMEQVNSPANVKERELAHKRASCEQNAKNRKLEGSHKESYLAECLHKNEAAAAAASVSVAAKPIPEKKTHPAVDKSSPAKLSPTKPPKKAVQKPPSCAQQAADKKLKGKELKKFISRCKDD